MQKELPWPAVCLYWEFCGLQSPCYLCSSEIVEKNDCHHPTLLPMGLIIFLSISVVPQIAHVKLYHRRVKAASTPPLACKTDYMLCYTSLYYIVSIGMSKLLFLCNHTLWGPNLRGLRVIWCLSRWKWVQDSNLHIPNPRPGDILSRVAEDRSALLRFLMLLARQHKFVLSSWSTTVGVQSYGDHRIYLMNKCTAETWQSTCSKSFRCHCL